MKQILLAGLIMFLVPPSAVFAHHGLAPYDTTTTVAIAGVVTEFHFSNPHSVIVLDVKGSNGKVEKWQGELTSPNFLERYGWTNHTIKIGDHVTLTGHPGKNGAKVEWVTRVTLPDGRELDTDVE